MHGVSPRSGFGLSEVVSLSGGEFDGWDEELLRRLEELNRVARERDELRHYGRIRKLRSPTAKLIYEFLRSHQPQTLLSIRHVLGVKRNTAPAAMRELVDKGYVMMDDEDTGYWGGYGNCSLSLENTIVSMGLTSHKIVVNEWGWGSVMKWFWPTEDWSVFDKLRLDVHNDGTTNTMTVWLRDEEDNEYGYTVTLTHSGWASIEVPLSEYSANNVSLETVYFIAVQFQEPSKTFYLDYIIRYVDSEAITVASEDVVDLDVQLREGSCPSARVTLNNVGQRYEGLNVTDEVEIRAGWDHITWLLFKGYIDTPEASYPPELMEVSSTRGYEKRLDYRETDEESWVDQITGDIIAELMEDYFGDVFRFSWNDGGNQVSVDSDNEAIGGFINKLADMSGYITYIDFNKDLHHVDPEDDWTQSNLEILEERDIISISNRLVDDVINRVTVKGASDTYTAEDEESQTRYWLRERTFRDQGLTSLGAVGVRANGLLETYRLPVREIPLSLPEFFIVELHDHVSVTCPKVGLNNREVEVKGVTYSYTSTGLRTQIQAFSRGFRLSDVLANHDKRLSEII